MNCFYPDIYILFVEIDHIYGISTCAGASLFAQMHSVLPFARGYRCLRLAFITCHKQNNYVQIQMDDRVKVREIVQLTPTVATAMVNYTG
jgi:hypothetical protein